MPIEVGVWRIDRGVEALPFKELDQESALLESTLQEIISKDISVVDPRLMVIGREVVSRVGSHDGGRLDVLAIDGDGNLAVLELKRNRTPRDIVAQILDYGSWVRHLSDEDIAQTYLDYQLRYLKQDTPESIDDALRKRFGRVPDSLNSSHKLIIVAGSLDPPTERIVSYLMEEFGVEINAVFFRSFEDEGREYLTRAWLMEPVELPAQPIGNSGEWNGEFYVSFGVGDHRRWADARTFGFVSAGGGEWYVNTLRALQTGDRIWVNVPGTGYVGVGIVTKPAVRFDQFSVKRKDGEVPIVDVEVEAPGMFDEEHGEHIVGVDWIKTVELAGAIKEIGFFGNQNSVARPRAANWQFTVERLKTIWNLT